MRKQEINARTRLQSRMDRPRSTQIRMDPHGPAQECRSLFSGEAGKPSQA